MKTSIDAFGTTVNINDEVIYYSGNSYFTLSNGIKKKSIQKGIVTKITPKGVTIDKVINRPSNKIYKVNNAEKLEKEKHSLIETLIKLAYLGGLPGHYGNSTGNQIAINELSKYGVNTVFVR